MPPKGKKRFREEEEEQEEDREEEEQDNDDENDGSNDGDGSDNDEGDGNDDDNEDGGDGDGDGDDDEDDQDNDNEEEDGDEEEEEAGEPEEEAPKKGGKKSPAAKIAKAPTKKDTKAKTPPAKKAKKVDAKKGSKKDTKSKAKKSSKKVIKKTSSSTSTEKSKPLVLKKMTKHQRLEEARKAYKWWEAPELPDGINWRRSEHPGIVFAPSYIRHKIPMKYDGASMKLTAEQEELASFYASMPEDGPQLGNPKTRLVFQQNFFKDFQETFPPGVVKKFSSCDFVDIKEYLDRQKLVKKAASNEEKAVAKAEKDKVVLKHGFALIDGRMEKMGNYNMEPPGLFRGRGDHPKTGTVKQRCFAESVHINLSEDAPVPRVDMPGHSWASVRHDPMVTWLCSWNENVNNSTKYVMLSASSSFKGKSDMDKYGKAIRLKHCIDTVRKDYINNIRSKDRPERQLGTAMWVIDRLALRVGGEKGEDEADTVGCCSLRKEHLKFNPDESTYEIELEFLGKDSMLYKQNINFVQYGDIGKAVYSCLKSFCTGKSQGDEIFETLNPSILNKHLSELMKGLSAKVFRTFNASVTLEKELPTAEDLEGLSVQEKVTRYNAANREVAILCNHQKTVSKSTEKQFENLNERLATLQDQRNKLIEWKGLVKKSKSIPLKDDTSDEADKYKTALEKANTRKENAKSNEDKIDAAKAVEDAKSQLNEFRKAQFKTKHMFAKQPAEDVLDKRIEKWTEDIRVFEIDIRNRDENKEVALGTSKINYMDPRISVAWCKRCEVPIDKIFAATLRDKFNWAMPVPPNWKFE